ncbi:MAG: hypothetical protein JSR30_08470, partial [Proteobacteria bacterium]|nr:hypothetical protein [Pseudomonadota bacterium]
CRAKQSHTAREQLVELVRINYPFHPRAGHEVEVLGRSRHGTEDFLIVRQPDGTRAHLPQWMTLPTAGDVPTHSPPRLLLRCLLALRRELDAVLSSSAAALSLGGVHEANPPTGAPARRADRPVRRRHGAHATDEPATASRRTHRSAESAAVAGGKPGRRSTTGG